MAAVDIGAGIYLLLSHGEYNGMEGILVGSFSAAAGVTIGMGNRTSHGLRAAKEQILLRTKGTVEPA
ncbi:MAG: hypothetical protein ACP5UC_01900 [Candidatus Micrarchaeia archaeon]